MYTLYSNLCIIILINLYFVEMHLQNLERYVCLHNNEIDLWLKIPKINAKWHTANIKIIIDR